MGYGVSALWISVALQSATPSSQARGASPYEIDAAADSAALAGLGLLLGATALVRHQAQFVGVCGSGSSPQCGSQRLVALDRYAVGRASQNWTILSDIAQAGGIGLPFALNALDVWHSGSDSVWRDWGADTIVMLEAQATAGLIANTLKLSIRRPRPRQYDSKLYRPVAQSEQSFPCGHCTATTAGATSLAVTFWWRHPTSPARYWVAAACALWSTLGSFARVEAGAHFPSDAIAGVGLGIFTGILVPWLHRAGAAADLSLGIGPRGEPTLRGRF